MSQNVCVDGACLCVFRVRGMVVCGLYVEVENVTCGYVQNAPVYACWTHAGASQTNTGRFERSHGDGQTRHVNIMFPDVHVPSVTLRG